MIVCERLEINLSTNNEKSFNFQTWERLEQINLVYKSFGQKIKNFIRTHFKVNNCQIKFLEAKYESVGDIMRQLDEKE